MKSTRKAIKRPARYTIGSGKLWYKGADVQLSNSSPERDPMRDQSDFISRAAAYVAASNAKDISAIEPMLDEDCRYVSTGVGDYSGKGAVISMMTTFFAANPDVHWSVADYALVTEDCVEFAFAISLGGRTSEGIERIWFAEDGAITCITVER